MLVAISSRDKSSSSKRNPKKQYKTIKKHYNSAHIVYSHLIISHLFTNLSIDPKMLYNTTVLSLAWMKPHKYISVVECALWKQMNCKRRGLIWIKGYNLILTLILLITVKVCSIKDLNNMKNKENSTNILSK
jgi:hypothetical protein